MVFDPFNCSFTVRSNPDALNFPKNLTKKEVEFLEQMWKWVQEKP